ncbi:fungal specific transcription factor domain-containing protein [Fusarium oxysporum f. sp. phaseoli]
MQSRAETGDEPGRKQNTDRKFILYGDYVSPYTITTAHALLEKGLTWEYRHIEIFKFVTRTPEHRKLHPFGKVPILDVLDDRGESTLRICESRAIARYIATAYSNQGNSLIPDISDIEAVALFEEASSMEVCYFSTAAWKYCGDVIVKPVDKKTLEDIWNELNGALKAMDGILSSREYLAGANFTLVDIWSMPWVSQLIDLKGADVLFFELPHMRNWWERVSLRPAWKEACALMDKAMEVMRQNTANVMSQPIDTRNDATDTQRFTRGGRRKRNEYALVACMLCKSRKVKCDGQWPCQRCTKRGVECSYPRRGNIPSMSPIPTEMSLEMGYSPSTEDGATPRISVTSGGATSSEASRLPARTSNSLSASLQSPAATDRSPTARRSSFVDTFSLARSCLETNGIVDQVEKDVQGPTSKPCLTLEQSLASASDDCLESILELGYDKARQLFITFAETIYPVYPCVDLHSAEPVLDAVFGRSAHHTTQLPSVNLTKVDILKALLGLTLLVENDSTSPLARHLQRYVDWSVEKLVMGKVPDPEDVVMATLMSLYFFHKSEHMRAWRLISLASRTCFELGLHQASEEVQKAVEIPGSFSPRELFCCVYVLDRTFSFATDLPHTTKDEDIDEKCFDLGTSAPFLVVTMEYTRLNSEIIGLLKPSTKSVAEGRQHKEYLDYKVQRLRDQFRDLTAAARSTTLPSKPWDPLQNEVLMNDLETFLEVRICHARILLRKPLLHSYKGDREKTAAVAVCVQCAKATIFLCSGVINKAVPLKCLRSSYEYFTVSSLAIILLVVSQDPETYGPESRDAFQEAIRILQVSKCRNFASGNLCFTFEQLIKIGERLHMPKDNNTPLLQDFGDIDMGQLLVDPQCVGSGDLQTLDDSIFGLFGMNRNWPANNSYI